MSRKRRFLATGTEPPTEVGVKISDISVEIGEFENISFVLISSFVKLTDEGTNFFYEGFLA